MVAHMQGKTNRRINAPVDAGNSSVSSIGGEVGNPGLPVHAQIPLRSNSRQHQQPGRPLSAAKTHAARTFWTANQARPTRSDPRGAAAFGGADNAHRISR